MEKIVNLEEECKDDGTREEDLAPDHNTDDATNTNDPPRRHPAVVHHSSSHTTATNNPESPSVTREEEQQHQQEEEGGVQLSKAESTTRSSFSVGASPPSPRSPPTPPSASAEETPVLEHPSTTDTAAVAPATTTTIVAAASPSLENSVSSLGSHSSRANRRARKQQEILAGQKTHNNRTHTTTTTTTTTNTLAARNKNEISNNQDGSDMSLHPNDSVDEVEAALAQGHQFRTAANANQSLKTRESPSQKQGLDRAPSVQGLPRSHPGRNHHHHHNQHNNHDHNDNDDCEDDSHSQPGAYYEHGRALGALPAWGRHPATPSRQNSHNSAGHSSHYSVEDPSHYSSSRSLNINSSQRLAAPPLTENTEQPNQRPSLNSPAQTSSQSSSRWFLGDNFSLRRIGNRLASTRTMAEASVVSDAEVITYAEKVEIEDDELSGNKRRRRRRQMMMLCGLGSVILLIIVVIAVVVTEVFPQSQGEDQTQVVIGLNITILHVNDVHSFLRGEDVTFDGKLLGMDNSDEIVVHLGGYPRLVTTVRNLTETAQQGGRSVLKLHAGNALTGTEFFATFRGEADAAMMNAVCFDAFTLGDDDFKAETLPDFIQNQLQQPSGDSSRGKEEESCGGTKVLSANLDAGANSPFFDLVNDGSISGSYIAKFGNERIGIVGITNGAKAMLNSIGDDTMFLDERSTVEKEIESLTASGINKIILLTHIGYEKDLVWAAELKDVDIVVGGGSQSLMGDRTVADSLLENLISQGQGGEGEYIGKYPTPHLNSAGKLVCIVQAWEHAKAIGKLDVSFDAEGSVVSCSGSTTIPFEVDDGVSVDLRQETKSSLEGKSKLFVETKPDEVTNNALTNFDAQLAEFAVVVGRVRFPGICLAWIPGIGDYSQICSLEDTASQGGGVGNLVGQAILDQMVEADISILNAGACLTDINSGNFTVLDGKNLLPFSNTVVMLNVTGQQIKTVLEEAVFKALDDATDGAYPYGAGIRFVVNGGADPFDRVEQLEVNSRLGGSWSPIVRNMTYRVATNSFIADGKDGYLEFEKVNKTLRVDTMKDYTETFLAYVEKKGTVADPRRDTYSTQSFLAATLPPSAAPSRSPTTLAPVTQAPSGRPVV